MNIVPETECPCCGKFLNAATAYNCKGAPSPGDVTVCLGCGAMLAFTEKMLMRLVPASEIVGPDWNDAKDLQRKIRAHRGLVTT